MFLLLIVLLLPEIFLFYFHYCYFVAACTKANKYIGTVSTAANGLTCRTWIYAGERGIQLVDSFFPDGSVAAARNYCRDPFGDKYLYCRTDNGLDACSVDLCN